MISAVILAAGESKRMGRCKQLLPWKDSTILETIVGNIIKCKLIDDEIRIVLGAYAEKIKPVLAKLVEPRLQIKENHNYQRGMLSSIRKGLEELPSKTTFIMFFLADQPLMDTEIINSIIKELLLKKPEIMVPVFQKKRGHPVIINRSLLPEVYRLSGPGGLRNLLKRYPEKVYRFTVANRSIIIDMDYFQEYKRYRRLFGDG